MINSYSQKGIDFLFFYYFYYVGYSKHYCYEQARNRKTKSKIGKMQKLFGKVTKNN